MALNINWMRNVGDEFKVSHWTRLVHSSPIGRSISVTNYKKNIRWITKRKYFIISSLMKLL